MIVRLKTGFMEVREYRVEWNRDFLVFVSGAERRPVRLSDLRSVTVSQPENGPARFTLETGAGEYQGSFLRTEDCDEFIRNARERSACSAELRLTRNQSAGKKL